MKIAALVPVRSGSKRIPNKNLATLGDETLLGRKLTQLKESQFLTHIYVGTDSEELAAEAEKYGVPAIMRDPKCCDEEQASANMMIEDFVRRVEADIIVWVHVTNPFVNGLIYDGAIKTFIEQEHKGFDSLISVLELKEHLWTPNKFPLNYNPYKERHTLAKDLPSYYKQTGAFFIQRYQTIRSNNYFFGKHPYLYKTTEKQAIDINTPYDLALANAMLNI